MKNGETLDIQQINNSYTPFKKVPEENKIPQDNSTKEDLIELNISDLVNIRKIARNSKMYQISDNIRDLLISKGIEIEDKDDKTIWKKLD